VASIGVLVVDDSVVIRRMVSAVLDDDPDIEVVGTAANGRIALDKLPQLRPDIIILDVEMPVMDGLATLRSLRPTHPSLPVIMFSTLTERGAMATLDALAAGASDYVTKPSHVGSVAASIDRVRVELIPKIKALVGASRQRVAPGAASRPRTPNVAARPDRLNPVEAIVIGCSTGGPDALAVIAAGLPADLGVPLIIVQHMPPLFTRLFADRLDRNCALSVEEARDGQVVEAGRVIVAAGDRHLVLRRSGNKVLTQLTQEPPENYCRPSVDVTFRSMASVYGGGVLACVMTGMGRDGAKGAERIHAAGGRVIVQDEESCVVWGMPGAVVASGIPAQIVPLHKIAETFRRSVGIVGRDRSGQPRPPSALGPAPSRQVAPAAVGAGHPPSYGRPGFPSTAPRSTSHGAGEIRFGGGA
jgi:two-component system, chemotaxis family, protein-glutamate methylesterase/glutaminase